MRWVPWSRAVMASWRCHPRCCRARRGACVGDGLVHGQRMTHVADKAVAARLPDLQDVRHSRHDQARREARRRLHRLCVATLPRIINCYQCRVQCRSCPHSERTTRRGHPTDSAPSHLMWRRLALPHRLHVRRRLRRPGLGPRLQRHPLDAAHGLGQQLRRRPRQVVLRLPHRVSSSCHRKSSRWQEGEPFPRCFLTRL